MRKTPPMATDLQARLREACIGHPAAKIPWPHRLLHEAVEALDTKDARVRELEVALEVCARYIESPLRMSSDEAEELRRAGIAARARSALGRKAG